MAKEKVRIDIPDSPFPFMPPVSELRSWLGGPKGLHTPLHSMQVELELTNQPDLKTLRKACRDGVTPRIAEMIKANIHDAARAKGFTDLLEEVVPTEPVVNGTNGAKWLQEAKSFLAGINTHQPMKLDLPLTFAFLEQRSAAESQLVLAFHNAGNMDAPTEKKLSLIRTAFCETCRHHTLLTSQEIQAYGSAIADNNRPGHPRTLELVADALKCTFSLRVDFYHQLLACFMADMLPLRKILKLTASLDKYLANQGAMGKLTPKLKDGQLITPTQQLYEYLQSAFEAPGKKISYRSMAKHLPLPDPRRSQFGNDSDQQHLENPADETRHSILKQWRRGGIPEADHLNKFLESLSGESYSAFLPFIMARVATVWTKWIERELTTLDQLMQEAPSLAGQLDREWLVTRFAWYPKYWRHAQAQDISATS